MERATLDNIFRDMERRGLQGVLPLGFDLDSIRPPDDGLAGNVPRVARADGRKLGR
jgi:hypothetical protein